MKWIEPSSDNGRAAARLSYYHDPDGRKARAREMRIDELMAEGGAEATALGREYWELVYDHEEAPFTTDFTLLREAGFDVPAPHTLDDDALSKRLWELIHELARMRVYLSFTDHLSDRQLYELLYEEALHEERRDIPMRPGDAWHMDLSLIGESDGAWADDVDVDDARDDEADPHMHESAVTASADRYDRDRHLPTPDYSAR